MISKKIKKYFALMLLKCIGWKIVGNVPQDVKKMVMLGAPHTSNWDFFVMVGCAWYYELNVKWLGKEAIFSNFIVRFFATLSGGIKVDRQKPDQAVASIAQALIKSPNRECLVIAPEGTRSKREGWKSGFYYIAKEANIPIGLGFADYTKRVMGVGEIIDNLEDLDLTMQVIKKFYQGVEGRHPKNQSPIKIIKKA